MNILVDDLIIESKQILLEICFQLMHSKYMIELSISNVVIYFIKTYNHHLACKYTAEYT